MAGGSTESQQLYSSHLLVHGVHAKGSCYVRIDTTPEVILANIQGYIQRGEAAQPEHNFSAGHGQRLSGTNIEWHTFPAPGINLQPQSGKN